MIIDFSKLSPSDYGHGRAARISPAHWLHPCDSSGWNAAGPAAATLRRHFGFLLPDIDKMYCATHPKLSHTEPLTH